MPDLERTLTLAPDVSSVRRGRTFARDVAIAWGVEGIVDDVQLGVSELITNAVRHAGTKVMLTMRLGSTLVVEVVDEDPDTDDLAPREQIDPLATSGRGLHIVAAVSQEWGTRSVPGGKAVWFALPLPDRAAADADVFAMSDHRHDAPEHGDRKSAVPSARGMRARAAT